MSIDKSAVARRVRELGARGALFQTRRVHEALCSPTDDKARNTIHNHFKSLVKDGAIEVVESDRSRNRYFKIADESRLNAAILNGRASGVLNTDGRPPSGPERLVRIENAATDLQQRMEHLEAKVDQLIAVWS